jgi:large repetitive protein
MKTFTTFFLALFMGIAFSLNGQNAPVVTIDNVSTVLSKATVSVTAIDFTDITSFDLKIKYVPEVAKPIAVTTTLPGDFYSNLEGSGVIKIGWSKWPEESVPDGTAIINIEFEKVSLNTSTLNFDLTNDIYCEFYGASAQSLNDDASYYNNGSVTFNEHVAPVTIAPDLTASVNDVIDVPITVTGFNNIGAVSLRLEYDQTVLSYNSSVNTGGFPGLTIFNPIPGTISVTGTTNDPVGYSLADYSDFFTLNFTYLRDAIADLNWYDPVDDVNDGSWCQYAGPESAYILPDTPQEDYYIDGSVEPDQPTPTPTITVGAVTNPLTCEGDGTIVLNFTNVPDSPPSYTITYDGGSFEGVVVSEGAATITAKAGTYDNLQITVGTETSAAGVNAELSDPEPPVASITPDDGILTCTVTSIVLDASGSTNAVSYEWNDGSTGSTLEVTEPGDYTVTVTAANGCTDIATVTVGQDINDPVASITPEDGVITCTVGSITLDASGSTNAVSYEWNDGSTGSTLEVSEPGTYSVTVTAANGCTASKTVTVGQDINDPVASITPEDGVLTCTVTSIVLDASGSTNAVSYEWNDGSTGSTLEVSEPGTYSVTVTAANGCTASKTVTVGQDINDPVASITPDDGILTCTVTSIVLDASGSTNAVSYEWNDGSTGSTLEVTEPGDYTVTVTAANGCTASKTVTVGQDETLPVASITPDDGILTCTVTSIVLDASGSTNAVSYEWNDGSTGSTLEVSEPGTYSVTVTAANGCTASKTVTVGQDETLPVASITPEDGVLTCTVGSITLDASGSTNAVSYEWNDGSTGSTLEVNEPGTYSVTVTAANGCTASKTVTVGQDINDPVASITPDDGILTCTVTSIVLDASGSTNAVSYEWNDGSTGSTLEVSEPGTYSVTVTAANGCTDIATVTVGQDINDPVASITPEDGVITCTVGSITLDASGSTNAVSYEWNDGSTGSTLEVSEPGTYSVTVTAANGCTASKTVTVGQDINDPVASITPEDGVLTCTVTSIVLDASGSTNAVSYEWNDGSTGSTLEVSEPGTYSVTVTAANGCTASKTVTVGQDINDPVASITPDDGILTCTVTSIVLDASGSTNAVSYEWNDGSTGSTLEVTEPGDYTVTVTAANGCTASKTVTVGQDETLPVASITPDDGILTCTVTSIVLDASGSTNAVSYEWNDGSTGSTLEVSEPGTYSVTVTAANGCTASKTVTVGQDETLPVASITPEDGVLTCTVGSITLDASGSTNAVSYEWNDGSTGSTLEVNEPGTYSVTVTAANGCTASKTVTVGQDETLPVASITPEDGILTCTVTSIVLDASGSTNAVSYEWNDGSTGSTLEVSEPGTYSVTVTAANGCTASKTVTVGQDINDPVASITPDDGVLTCTVTSITLDASGSTNAVSYEWNDGSTGSTLEVTEPGDYTVTVTAANGCTASKTVTVGQDINDPVASITPDDGVITCTVGSITLDASGSTNAVSYEWNDGSTGSTLEVTEPGDYTVTVTAANGCTASKTVTVGQDETLTGCQHHT